VPSLLKRGERLVPVPLWIAGKLALYLAMRDKQVNNSQLGRMLGVRETVVLFIELSHPDVASLFQQ